MFHMHERHLCKTVPNQVHVRELLMQPEMSKLYGSPPNASEQV